MTDFLSELAVMGMFWQAGTYQQEEPRRGREEMSLCVHQDWIRQRRSSQ
jgi:hypothetical protein